MTTIDTTICHLHQYLPLHNLITTIQSFPLSHHIATCNHHCTIKMINTVHGKALSVMIITIGQMVHLVTYQILWDKVDILLIGKNKDITKIITTINMLDLVRTFINSLLISTCHCRGLREMMGQRGRWKTWIEILGWKWSLMIVMMKEMEETSIMKEIRNKGRQGLDRARIYLNWKGLRLLRFMDWSFIDRVWSVFEYFFIY